MGNVCKSVPLMLPSTRIHGIHRIYYPCHAASSIKSHNNVYIIHVQGHCLFTYVRMCISAAFYSCSNCFTEVSKLHLSNLWYWRSSCQGMCICTYIYVRISMYYLRMYVRTYSRCVYGCLYIRMLYIRMYRVEPLQHKTRWTTSEFHVNSIMC